MGRCGPWGAMPRGDRSTLPTRGTTTENLSELGDKTAGGLRF